MEISFLIMTYFVTKKDTGQDQGLKNSGKIIFILNINGTETRHRHKKSHRQEYVPEVEECVSRGNPCGD